MVPKVGLLGFGGVPAIREPTDELQSLHKPKEKSSDRRAMAVVYFKRYRMQFDLRSSPIPEEQKLPEIEFLEWDPKILPLHGIAKWESFRREMDVNIFPCLGDKEGCKQLMRDIFRNERFVPEATWLAQGWSEFQRLGPVAGTIQGLRTSAELGSIQNIGVVPAFRGKGIGRELIRRNLLGFREVGCRIVQLEVTIHNFSAIQLYESIGFQRVETVYKVGNIVLA